MSTTAPILLEAQGVAKHYGKFVALGGVDLKVRANTVHSVIGPNGAGKTTLFHMLTGTKAVSGGRILFDGHDVTREPDHRRVRRGMARSFQVTSLFLTLPVRENLRLAAQGVAPAKALDCWHTPTGPRSCAETVAQVLERVGLTRHAATPAVSISGWVLTVSARRSAGPSQTIAQRSSPSASEASAKVSRMTADSP